ncbi:MAG TPA: TetR/AcrR family transcriptional regulator C-terminal ligand-binding domain-containing protein [Pseudonocardia sp.]|jgi:AcrR family transcriptional regulator|nr:TetR/AcrR family transcriptional regulator C-terminal ligand-binding domain-containing protein [Pseudonocardia sp.]
MSNTSEGRVRPGGRTARTRQAVHAAVRGLLSEGRDPISVREVSDRSGVHEVTIYRRWGTVESLVLDVAVTQLNDESPFPDTGDLRRDLLAWAHSVAQQVKTREGFALFRALAAANPPPGDDEPASSPTADAHAHLRRRTDQIQLSIDHGAGDLEHPPTVARVFDLVLAPIYLRAVFGYATPDTDLAELVDRALGQAR